MSEPKPKLQSVQGRLIQFYVPFETDLHEDPGPLMAVRRPLIQFEVPFDANVPEHPGPLLSVRGPVTRVAAAPAKKLAVELKLTLREGVGLDSAFEHLVPVFGFVKLLGYSWERLLAENGQLVYRLTPPSTATAQDVQALANILQPLVWLLPVFTKTPADAKVISV